MTYENIGIVDLSAIENEIEQTKKKRSNYIKWTDKERYEIGKYASQNGVAAAVRHYKNKYDKLNESTVRGFKSRVEEDLKKATKNKVQPSNLIATEPRGRPPMLGEIDEKVQTYIHHLSKRGGLISRAIAVSTAKALIQRDPNYCNNLEITESWAQSLFRRMGFVRRIKTSSKVEIPEGARKEIEFQFLQEIVRAKERWDIPDDLILNFDQTPSKLVPVGQKTMAQKGSTNVTLVGSSDKKSITATFAVSLSGIFLPPQLIYGGKTNQSLPKYKFPASFSLSVNPTHYSNTDESIKYLKEIIIPYVKQKREELGIPDQKALIIFDVFTGQMTTAVKETIERNNLIVVNVPANMTKYYQVLDLTVNKYAKEFTKKKFCQWYSNQVSTQLDQGKDLDDIDIKLRLSVLKPIHADWLVEFYNHMTTSKGKEIIFSGWQAAGISDAIRLGSNELPSVDPFNDIDPMISPEIPLSSENLEGFCDDQHNQEEYVRQEESDSDEEWETSSSTRNAFDIFEDNFDDEDL